MDTEYMTVEEVATLFRVSKMTVYRMVKADQIESVKTSPKTIRIPTRAVHAYIEAGLQGGAA